MWMYLDKLLPGINEEVRVENYLGEIFERCVLQYYSEGQLLEWRNLENNEIIDACEVVRWQPIAEVEDEF